MYGKPVVFKWNIDHVVMGRDCVNKMKPNKSLSASGRRPLSIHTTIKPSVFSVYKVPEANTITTTQNTVAALRCRGHATGTILEQCFYYINISKCGTNCSWAISKAFQNIKIPYPLSVILCVLSFTTTSRTENQPFIHSPYFCAAIVYKMFAEKYQPSGVN